ncbi:MAG TPA: helix-hairpin-helix domain-containing protein [Ohtaekwangia sp.]|uniref:ComEA family DNA-binding protein n=1 Tax=Ohtaekwangia sp. TaxID=2066019 RepID=UPI002F939E2E
MIHRWLKKFFGFSRSQVNACIVLLPLMAIIIFSEPLYHQWTVRYGIHVPPEQQKLDSMITEWRHEPTENSSAVIPAKRATSLFPFDPNIIGEDKFMLLGFHEKIARRIIHYRDKGGRFRIKSDLMKMYGMDSSFYKRIFSYIQLPDAVSKQPYVAENKTPEREPGKALLKFDLNMADTAQLKKIYGIGEKRALRIVAYREKLGGFVTMEQLYEVYTLDSTVVEKLAKASFIEQTFNPQKININNASEQELATHPYLRKFVAKAIVAYRFQHGKIKDVEDLGKIQTLDPKTIQKIKPYFNFD